VVSIRLGGKKTTQVFEKKINSILGMMHYKFGRNRIKSGKIIIFEMPL